MLDAEVRKEAEGLLKMKVNKKLLQQHLSEATGKIITMRDITNIQVGSSKNEHGNNLELLVSKLRKVEDDNCHITYISKRMPFPLHLRYAFCVCIQWTIFTIRLVQAY